MFFYASQNSWGWNEKMKLKSNWMNQLAKIISYKRKRTMFVKKKWIELNWMHYSQVICEESETQNGSQVQSFGKRKKRQSIEELSKMMKRLRPQFASPRASQKGREDVDDSKEKRVKVCLAALIASSTLFCYCLMSKLWTIYVSLRGFDH